MMECNTHLYDGNVEVGDEKILVLFVCVSVIFWFISPDKMASEIVNFSKCYEW